MSYEKQFNEAEEKKATADVSYEQYRWVQEGQTLFGKLLAFEEVQSKDNKQPYMRYLFDTDSGKCSLSLGKSVDFLLADEANIGNVFKVVYTGKKDLGSGRSMNTFQIKRIA